jgi:CheY-like chemotaxis protein
MVAICSREIDYFSVIPGLAEKAGCARGRAHSNSTPAARSDALRLAETFRLNSVPPADKKLAGIAEAQSGAAPPRPGQSRPWVPLFHHWVAIMSSTHAPILVVEDEKNDAFFLTMAFEQAGMNPPAHVARDGSEAIDYLAGEGKFSNRKKYPRPCLMLLDLNLPKVAGLEVLKWVREKPEFDSTIVIVLTSSQDPHDVETAYQLKANAYLVKPNGLDKLRAQVEAIKSFWLMQNQPHPKWL